MMLLFALAGVACIGLLVVAADRLGHHRAAQRQRGNRTPTRAVSYRILIVSE